MTQPQEAARPGDTSSGLFFSAARFERPGLTGLRALAAGWVVVFHLNGIAGPRRIYAGAGDWLVDVTPLLTGGWVGVDMFFVLSGFLLTLHYLERRSALPEAEARRGYLRARVLRVVPAYWAQIALLFLLTWIATGAIPSWSREIPAHLAFVNNATHENGINGVYWSLPVEFTFYLFLPFVAAWLARRGGAPVLAKAALLLALAVAGELAWRRAMVALFAGGPPGELFTMTSAQFPGSMDQFAWGVAAAVAFAVLRDRSAAAPRRSDLLWLLGLAALVAWMGYLHVHIQEFSDLGWLFYAWHPVAGGCIAVMVLGIAGGGPVARIVWENRVVVWLGTISYSVYLWHFVIAQRLAPYSSLGILGFSAIAIPPILLASVLSYHAFERPFLRRRRRAGAP